MHHPLKVTSTLADETRFSIYEYILQSKLSFTVGQIAERFEIHPNVARLHLTKLAEIGVIIAELEKTGKGGRPGRVYRMADETITLSFPKKENDQLLDWTLALVSKIGAPAIEAGKEISYSDGYNSMKKLKKHKNCSTINQKLSILSEAASLIGYIPISKITGAYVTIQFTIYNCPYEQYIKEHREVICQLHEAFLRGQMDALFGDNEFVQYEHMNAACQFCHYDICTKL
jgi:predicted ArsR family transcriptional regulator